MSDQIVPVYDAINHTTNVLVNYDSDKLDTRYAFQEYNIASEEINASYIDVKRFNEYATNFCFTASQIQEMGIVMQPKHTAQEQVELEKHQTKKLSEKQQFVYCNRKLLEKITMETAEQAFPVPSNQYYPDMTLHRLYEQYNTKKFSTMIRAAYNNQISFALDIEKYSEYSNEIKNVVDHVEKIKDIIGIYADDNQHRVFVDYDTVLLTKAIIQDVTDNFSNLKSTFSKLPSALLQKKQEQSSMTVDELVRSIYSLMQQTKENNPAHGLLTQAYFDANTNKDTETEIKKKERETLQKKLVDDTVKQYADILELRVKAKNIVERYRDRTTPVKETADTIKTLETCAQMLAAMGALVSQILDIHLFHAVSFSGNIAYVTGITGMLAVYTVLSQPQNPYYKRITETATLLALGATANAIVDAAVTWGPTIYAAKKVNDGINFVTGFFIKKEINLLPALLSKLTSYARQGVVDLSLVNWFRNINAFSICSASVNLLILNVLMMSLVQGYYTVTEGKKARKDRGRICAQQRPGSDARI